jgi:hypothetical protein
VNVEVVIPHGRADCEQRQAVRAHVAASYVRCHPSWSVRLAGCPTRRWSKGAAANPVICASRADVVILADADSTIASQALAAAVIAAARTGWAVPHTRVQRIGQDDTARILAGQRGIPTSPDGERPALPGGGIVVATRQAWQTVNGVDPRFFGWGGEDQALGMALTHLVGQPWTPPAPVILWHLWHPSGPRTATDQSKQLWRRYKTARCSPDMMRDLVKEW